MPAIISDMRVTPPWTYEKRSDQITLSSCDMSLPGHLAILSATVYVVDRPTCPRITSRGTVLAQKAV
ncbi:hypothetical protein GCM10010160_49380 [Acrocarpospora corrugata]